MSGGSVITKGASHKLIFGIHIPINNAFVKGKFIVTIIQRDFVK